MRRIYLLVLILILAGAGVLGQQIGDQTTAGYTSARTNFNSDFGPEFPPFSLFSTIDLTGTTNASSLLAFTSQGTSVFLVGESTTVSTDYRLYNSQSGVLLWTNSITNALGLSLNYTPAVANDVVILGGPATTTIKAVQVSTGTELWQDTSVGGTAGIHPFITNGLAIYGGNLGFRGVHPTMGPNPAFWTMAVTTLAQAPVASFGQQAYIHATPASAGISENVLYAINRTTGEPLWSASGVLGSDNPNIIPTESLVFVNDDNGMISALDSTDGSIVWARQGGLLSMANPTALAYDRLYLFADSAITSAGVNFGMDASITALDPNTGNPLWSVSEVGQEIRYASVANNVIYYYHVARGRVRARDAFNGTLLWSLQRDDVRGMAVVDGSIVLLFADQVEIYRPITVLYFAQIADGEGQSTLLAITNRSDELVNATLNFFDPEGNLLSLPVDGVGMTSSVIFTVSGGSSARIQTSSGDMVQRGWAQIIADGPLSGSSIFQARDMDGFVAFEAGVSSSLLRGRGNVFTEFLTDDVNPSRAINTALALANPSNEEATVELVLVDPDGMEIASSMRVLQPGQQIAEFVDQLFPGQLMNPVVGSVRIRSAIPIIVTALRTQGGFQLSSYDVGQ